MTQPVEYEQVTYNSVDGAQIGSSATEKIAFYGTTPVVKQTVTGSVSSGAATSSLIVALALMGLITNSSAA